MAVGEKYGIFSLIKGILEKVTFFLDDIGYSFETGWGIFFQYLINNIFNIFFYGGDTQLFSSIRYPTYF